VGYWGQLVGGMPQGSWLGPLIFLLLIDDLQLDCLVHKYVDDTTLSELLASGDQKSHIIQHVENLRTWSQANKMIINLNKSKEVVLGCLAKQPIGLPCLTTQFGVIKRVTTFKLLGITLSSDKLGSTHKRYLCKSCSTALLPVELS